MLKKSVLNYFCSLFSCSGMAKSAVRFILMNAVLLRMPILWREWNSQVKKYSPSMSEGTV